MHSLICIANVISLWLLSNEKIATHKEKEVEILTTAPLNKLNNSMHHNEFFSASNVYHIQWNFLMLWPIL